MNNFWKNDPKYFEFEKVVCETNGGHNLDMPFDIKVCIPKRKKKEQSGSCLLGSTQILMENGTTKAISEIQSGEVILNGYLNPVVVHSVITNFLYDRTMYQFKDGPIFTEDHLFYSNLELEKLGKSSVHDLSYLVGIRSMYFKYILLIFT